jgi:hypothetical protein
VRWFGLQPMTLYELLDRHFAKSISGRCHQLRVTSGWDHLRVSLGLLTDG